MKRGDFLKALGLGGLGSLFPFDAEAEQPKIVPLHNVETVHFGEGGGLDVKACYLDGKRITNLETRTFCAAMNVKEGWVDVLQICEDGRDEWTRRYGVVTYDLWAPGEQQAMYKQKPFDGAPTKPEGLSVRATR